MNIIDIIDKKRRGLTHHPEEIYTLVSKMMSEDIPDYQITAWLMATTINGLTIEETTWLTDAFVKSGQCLDWSEVNGVTVDKHSTGGVGDKTTLALIPMLAGVSLKVAKLSGRGLGFTGGTIDKLEAIPGFQVALSQEQFIRQVRETGMAISSQTADLAPADGKMYALRDVTATVESIPLIAASVVSKKIAAGADVIVLDIKYGNGAFMKDLALAKELAQTCREVGRRLGKTISTVLSSMEQPLGFSVGHSLEVLEVLDLLQGKGPSDLEVLCLKLGSVAMVSAGLESSIEKAEKRLKQTLNNGIALQHFKTLIHAQGGDIQFMTTPACLPGASTVLKVKAEQAGTVSGLDALAVAKAAKLLGAGRSNKGDTLDLGVGILLRKKIGDTVNPGSILAELHSNGLKTDEAFNVLKAAFSLSEKQPQNQISLIDDVVLAV